MPKAYLHLYFYTFRYVNTKKIIIHLYFFTLEAKRYSCSYCNLTDDSA